MPKPGGQYMLDELLLNVLLNQMVIMGGILHPDNEWVRQQIMEQIEHTKAVISKVKDVSASRAA